MPDPVIRLNAALAGRYRIGRELGEGGMATVYLADDLRHERKVALKVLKRTSDLTQVLARFEAERRALAMMDHPSIAKVFDTGTAAGETYFVMEFVDGEPIHEYCDRWKLTIRARCELFTQVCSAVQHAHQKGIIHRDLKPSNVLVSEVDGRPLPRVIDFGIAKATGTGDFDGTRLTRTGQVIGTPAYMSPEQLDGSGDMDTRTDVYSLGVLLYELLVGALPYSRRSYRSWAGVAAQISKDPPTLAERLSALADTQETLGQLRSTTPRQMRRELSGDLGWIVAHAMSRDRERRYAAASDLTADLDRFLRHEPIVGRAAGLAYVVGKFARRHRVGVGVAATAAAGLIGIAVVSTVQADRIAEERNRAVQRQGQAEDLLNFVVGDLRSDLASLGRLDVLDDVASQTLEYFASVDVDDLSEEELTRQVEVLTQLGEIRVNQLQYQEALTAFREAYERSVQLYAAEPEDGERLFARSQAEFWVGYISYLEADWDTARSWLERYLESSLELRSLDPSRRDWMREVAFSHNNLAVLEFRGYRDLAAAREGFSRAAAIWDSLLVLNPSGEAIQDRVMTLSFQADVARDLGLAQEYLRYHSETVERMRQALGEDPDNARWLGQLARYLSLQSEAQSWMGLADAALAGREEAGAIYDGLLLRDSTNQTFRRDQVGNDLATVELLVALGRVEAADSVIESSVRVLDGMRSAGIDSATLGPTLRLALWEQARLGLGRGDLEAALESVQQAIDLDSVSLPGSYLVLLGEIQASLGDHDLAADTWREALDILEPRAEISRAPEVLVPLARALLLSGRTEEGEALVTSISQMGYQPLPPWPAAPHVGN